MHLANNYNVTGFKQDVVCCQALNTGLYAAAKFYERTVWIGAGSDSNNDYVGNYHGLYLSYARKSGFGGYGDLKRGARIWSLEKKQSEALSISAYVRDVDGAHNVGMEEHFPPTFSFSH